MREKVTEYVANFLYCIEFSPPSGKAERFLHSIPKEKLPFATKCISFIKTKFYWVFQFFWSFWSLYNHF